MNFLAPKSIPSVYIMVQIRNTHGFGLRGGRTIERAHAHQHIPSHGPRETSGEERTTPTKLLYIAIISLN